MDEKLRIGIKRLSEAGNNSSLLGSALVSLHGALEDYIRFKLSNNSRLPSAQRALAADRQKTQWVQLLDWLEQYDHLAPSDRQKILRFNSLRQSFAHGDEFGGTRAELEDYASFVQNMIGNSKAAGTAASQQTPSPINIPSVLCPCGSRCKGSNRYGSPPQCFQSYSGDSMPYAFRRREMAKEKGFGGKFALGILMGIFEGTLNPIYAAYQCPVCGCEVLFASYNSSGGSNIKRVGDTCSC